MFGTALRDGLRGWARAPIRICIGGGVMVALLALAYALAIEISPNVWWTALIGGVIAILLLGGWMRFCSEQVRGGKAAWRALLAGVRRPLSMIGAGTFALGLILLPAFTFGSLAASVGAPNWLFRLCLLAITCLTMPTALLAMFALVSGCTLPAAITSGVRLALGHWQAFAALTLLTFGLAASGPLPGLLLERHAIEQTSALLPSAFAEYGLAIVRLVTLLGIIASVSAASCVWASAWRQSGGKRP